MALTIAGVVISLSVSGCGAGRAALGIREPPKANPALAPITIAQAKSILTRDFTAVQQGGATTGAAAQAAHSTAYMGEALRAANAQVRLASVQPLSVESPVLTPLQPRLLAVSRGFGFPRAMVAQTVAAEGSLPVLHLLMSPDASTPYRISMSATMLPSSTVEPFGPLAQGSPLLTNGAGLVVSGTELLGAYAAGMAFPAKAVTNPPFVADDFATQVRAKAAAVGNAVASQASFSQVHKVIPGSIYAVRQANGDALVFGVIERTDSFEVKQGQAVNTAGNREFVVLTGKNQITRSATITRLEFVVFEVPQSEGRAILVAASEQVVAGSGS